RRAEDLSHMFFGQGIHVRLSGLFDTHPPVAERIRRAHPRFMVADYRKTRAQAIARHETAEQEEEETGKTPVSRQQAAVGVLVAGSVLPAGLPQAGRRGADSGQQWGRSAKDSAAIVGSMDGGKVDYAARLLKA